LLLSASSIWGSTSDVLPSTTPDTSPPGVSAPTGLGDRGRDHSVKGGEVVGVSDRARPTLALESGAVAAAAINKELKDGEGEEMRDIDVEEGFVGARKDGGSGKQRNTDCAA
jgi:hypothetical protein